MELILESRKHGNKVVYYDEQDHELISQFNWYVFKNGYGFYAMSTRKNKLKKCVFMHRLIMDVWANPKTIIDHANRIGLDNRRSNLRVATKSQNQQNLHMTKRNFAGYKGVHVIRRKNIKYRARIRANGVRYDLGVFKNPKEAARAYNEAAIRFYGEFACINQIDG